MLHSHHRTAPVSSLNRVQATQVDSTSPPQPVNFISLAALQHLQLKDTQIKATGPSTPNSGQTRTLGSHDYSALSTDEVPKTDSTTGLPHYAIDDLPILQHSLSVTTQHTASSVAPLSSTTSAIKVHAKLLQNRGE